MRLTRSIAGALIPFALAACGDTTPSQMQDSSTAGPMASTAEGTMQGNDLTLELVRILPSTLWFIFAVVALWIFQRSIRHDLLPRLSSFKGLGVELAFLKDQLDGAIKKTEATVSRSDRRGVLKRAELAQAFLQGGQVLWVDDNPQNNSDETELFRSLGMRVKAVTNSAVALQELRDGEFNVVISDFAREGDPEAGPALAKAMWDQKIYSRTIIYTGSSPWGRPTPPYLFGITNRPDHLIHYVIDVMEREATS
jgi:hypothetical protein